MSISESKEKIKDLQEMMKITKRNIRNELKHIRKNETVTGLDGNKYGPDHWKEAIKHDEESYSKMEKDLSNERKKLALKAKSLKVYGGIEPFKKKKVSLTPRFDRLRKEMEYIKKYGD